MPANANLNWLNQVAFQNLNVAPRQVAQYVPPERLEKPEYSVEQNGDWVQIKVREFVNEPAYVWWEFTTKQAEHIGKLLQSWMVKKAHAGRGT